MLSGWDCAWTTNLIRVPVWRSLAKWPTRRSVNVVVKGLGVAVRDDVKRSAFSLPNETVSFSVAPF